MPFGAIMFRLIEYLIAERQFQNFFNAALQRKDMFQVFKENEPRYTNLCFSLDALGNMLKLNNKETGSDVNQILLTWVNMELTDKNDTFAVALVMLY